MLPYTPPPPVTAVLSMNILNERFVIEVVPVRDKQPPICALAREWNDLK
jgi:hypothetical protein